MELVLILDKLILCLALFVLALTVAAYSTLAERKIAAWIQDRHGPERAGPWGLLQPLADGGKMFFKEEITPNKADKALFIFAPALFMFTALITYAVIPWGRDLVINGRNVALQVANLNIGVLYSFGIASIGVYGILIGGWASNNKFSLLGAVRASSQMISYELALGMSIIPIVMMTGSLNLREMVDAQQGVWNIFLQPVAFIIFFTCALAECNRAPFDLAETESELMGGYLLEYSSMKMALFMFAEYVHMFISSALITVLFFGGYNFPFMNSLDLPANIISILSVIAFLSKTFFFIFVFMWIRWTLPRFKYDQLMRLGWKIFIPLAILNILVTGIVMTIFK